MLGGKERNALLNKQLLSLFLGGLIPVLSVLRYFKAPRLWPSRWAYLVTPHIRKFEDDILIKRDTVESASKINNS